MRVISAIPHMKTLRILPLLLLLTLSLGSAELPNATHDKLPRWRGFNLLEKFIWKGKRESFHEEDFRWIHELGFNFVRLPMDYRGWIQDGNWEKFDEESLRQIDQAVQWGEKYDIHVCLNFHRAPGYTVARPAEVRDLWTDPEAQRVCALHWATFARRYRGIPNERLSFNLLNEPADIHHQKFVVVMRRLIDAIRAVDPDRLIICDGLKWGQQPVPEFADLKVAAATRGYTPSEISHYGATWVNSTSFPYPEWPRYVGSNGLLHGPWKKNLAKPLVIDGPFPTDTEITVRVGIVSTKAQFQITADDKVVLEKDFVCAGGQGEWKKAIYQEQWKTWQNLYDRDYTASIPAETKQVTLRVTEGDWLEVRRITLSGSPSKASVSCDQRYGSAPGSLRWDGVNLAGAVKQDGEWLWTEMIEPWKAAEARGVGIVVGEWGCYNQTPHDVVMRWAEDNLKNWQRAEWGWALWNFRGPFGILDSDRKDITPEDFHGHALDRKLLDLLQKY